MMNQISCICPTFNRIETLNETVESFLRQDFQGEKELIIVNDFPKHELHFNHPNIKIVESDGKNLGECSNNAIRNVAQYDLIAPWEDDDIYLPNNLSVRIKYLKDFQASTINNAYFIRGNTIRIGISKNLFHGQMIFTREIFESVGGYPETFQAHDGKFVGRIPINKIVRNRNILPDDISYIYRWGLAGQRNLSSFFDPNNIDKTLENITKFRESQINDNTFKVIEIAPKWNRDYLGIVDYVRKGISRGDGGFVEMNKI